MEVVGDREERVVGRGALAHGEVRDPPRDRLARLGGLRAAAPFPTACPPARTRPSRSRRARPTPGRPGQLRELGVERLGRLAARGDEARETVERRSARPARRRFRSSPVISVVTRATRPVVVEDERPARLEEELRRGPALEEAPLPVGREAHGDVAQRRRRAAFRRGPPAEEGREVVRASRTPRAAPSGRGASRAARRRSRPRRSSAGTSRAGAPSARARPRRARSPPCRRCARRRA